MKCTKALLHLAPGSLETEQFGAELRRLATEISLHPDSRNVRVTPMIRLVDDPFRDPTPLRGTIELKGDGADAALLTDIVSNFSEWVCEISTPEASSLLLGEDVVFIASEQAPVRYQYLMRRNDDFDHASYLERYREVHSQFGIDTPGILGYTQFHVDEEASMSAAREVGLAICRIDSVSELHLASVETFLAEVSRSSISRKAVADEEIFVDRANSHQFCSRVEWR